MAVGGVPNPLATMRRVQSKPASSDRTPYQVEVRKWMESDPRGFTMDLAKLERQWKETLAKRKAAKRAGRGRDGGDVGKTCGSDTPAALPAPDENAARALALCRSLLAKMSARRGEAGGDQGDPAGVPPL